MKKRTLCFLLLFFILTDIGYTFYQHLQVQLDGDISGGVLPNITTAPIFNDPFGITVITENKTYANPNRFFAHWAFSNFFTTVPFLCQKITDPINSIYISCAIFKTLLQVLLLIVLALYITGNKNIFHLDNLTVITLLCPLFQTNGYISYMGVIDHSITYTFFYALPIAFLLLFYFPFFDLLSPKESISDNKLKTVLLIALALILPFSGPLIPGVILIITMIYFSYQITKHNNNSELLTGTKRLMNRLKLMPRLHLICFLFISLLSLYSLYIGTHNSIFIGEEMPILQRYIRLPQGLYYLVSQKIGFPILILMVLINYYIINKYYLSNEGKKILTVFKLIGIFSLMYIILLPLGGYKSYRPFILRYDTALPLTISLFFLFGLSTFFLLKNSVSKYYKFAILAFILIFTLADKPETGKNICEKDALNKLAASNEKVVLISNDCTIMSWKKITDPKDSEENSKLLKYWKITEDPLLYYQK